MVNIVGFIKCVSGGVYFIDRNMEVQAVRIGMQGTDPLVTAETDPVTKLALNRC
jgi:hypothetical protein